MSAFLAWMMSSEPCTPSQTAIVCAVVFGVLVAELVGIAWLCARAADDGKPEKTENRKRKEQTK